MWNSRWKFIVHSERERKRKRWRHFLFLNFRTSRAAVKIAWDKRSVDGKFTKIWSLCFLALRSRANSCMLESWREKRKDRSKSNSTRTGIRSHATRKKIISRYIDLQIYTYTHMYAQVNRLNVIKYRRSVLNAATRSTKKSNFQRIIGLNLM